MVAHSGCSTSNSHRTGFFLKKTTILLATSQSLRMEMDGVPFTPTFKYISSRSASMFPLFSGETFKFFNKVNVLKLYPKRADFFFLVEDNEKKKSEFRFLPNYTLLKVLAYMLIFYFCHLSLTGVILLVD